MLKKIALMTLAGALCIGASAKGLTDEQIDSTVVKTKILVLDNGLKTYSDPQINEEAYRRIAEFYYDQFRHSQDPGAPYFMFMSRNQEMGMGIGGTVRMRGWYDWAGPVSGNAFMPINIPMTPDPANRNKLGATPSGTCLYFRVFGSNNIMGKYQAYIEANFNGYQGRDFHLKKAYVTFRDFTVGYASSTFSDPAAVSPTVDSSGPSNKLDHTTVLFRYMPRLATHVLGAVSVELPEDYVDADGVNTQKRDQYIPDVAAFLQYDWGTMNSEHVRLAAIYRSLPYRDLREGRNFDPAGWGVQLSSVFHPVSPLTVYLTANYGAGYAGMGGDLLAGAYDLIGNPEQTGRMYAPRSFGWSVGLQYNIRRNLFVSLTGSQTRFLPSKAIAASEYKYGMMGALNVFWNPFERVQFGAELDLGVRHNFSHRHRYARRFGLMAQLSF